MGPAGRPDPVPLHACACLPPQLAALPSSAALTACVSTSADDVTDARTVMTMETKLTVVVSRHRHGNYCQLMKACMCVSFSGVGVHTLFTAPKQAWSVQL